MTKSWPWDDCEITVVWLIGDYLVAGLKLYCSYDCKRSNCQWVSQWASNFLEYRGTSWGKMPICEINLRWLYDKRSS